MIRRQEEGRRVVAHAEVALRVHHGAVATRDVIRDQVQHDLHSCGVDPRDERFELVHARRRRHRVIRADVVVVADRVEGSRAALHDVAVVGPEPRVDGGPIGQRGLPEHAGEPDVRRPEIAQRREGHLVDVGELPGAVLLEGPVRNPTLDLVREVSHDELIDDRPGARVRVHVPSVASIRAGIEARPIAAVLVHG